MAGISKTVISVQPGQMQNAQDYITSLSDRVASIDGIISYGFAVTGENELTVVGVYGTKDEAEAATPVVQEVFGEIASMVTGAPERGVFEGEWFTK